MKSEPVVVDFRHLHQQRDENTKAHDLPPLWPLDLEVVDVRVGSLCESRPKHYRVLVFRVCTLLSSASAAEEPIDTHGSQIGEVKNSIYRSCRYSSLRVHLVCFVFL